MATQDESSGKWCRRKVGAEKLRPPPLPETKANVPSSEVGAASECVLAGKGRRQGQHTHLRVFGIVSGGASAVEEPAGHSEVRKASSQVRSPGFPDAAKGSYVLNDLTDLHCKYCTGCVIKIN